MALVLGEEQDPISSVLDEEQEPISGGKAKDSIMVIMHQEEPTTGDGGMTSDKTAMSIQVTNGLDQMPNKL